MKTKRIKDSSSPSEQSDLGPSKFPVAVGRIAVAQICQYVGYKGAQNSALETLTDVAVRYLRSLAKSAANSAGSTGRTQCNLLDIVRALEDLHSVIGFNGNSEPKRRLYLLSDSSVLCDMMKFVNWTHEIPFAKPLHRRRHHIVPLNPPRFPNDKTKWNHIPRWLPAFPKITEGGEKTVVPAASEGEMAWEKKMRSIRPIGNLPEKRKKVSFKVGGGGGRNEIETRFGVDWRSGDCKVGKRISCQNYEEDGSSSSSNHDTNPSMKKKSEEAPKRHLMFKQNQDGFFAIRR